MGILYSMTGYGSAKGTVEGLTVTVEIKSVNNRFLDCSVRLPKGFQFAELRIKETVTSQIHRGKVEVNVSIQGSQDTGTVVSVNRDLAREYYNAVTLIAKTLDIKRGLDAMSIARFPDVLTLEKRELDKQSASDSLALLAEEAVREFNGMRAREGQRLKEDLLSKLVTIEGLVSTVEERSPETVREYRQRLEARLRELLDDRTVDEQRLITETAIFADRIAVDEETVRLRSHIDQFRAILEEGSPTDRKLEFLLQEFNRESNTIGSKCNDMLLSSVVVDLKAEIEKLREQIQNVE